MAARSETTNHVATPGDRVRAAIRAEARALGFDAVGFARPEIGDAGAKLDAFLDAGWHGTMGWMARNADRRRDPRAIWPEARSVVLVGTNYAPKDDPLALLAHKDRGNISVYARSRDYHDVMKPRLRKLGEWLSREYRCEAKLFVDTAPIMEKPLAERAGIGWRGKHTNLVSREFGSWLFLGALFTTLDLAPDAAEEDHCGSCRRCLDICPTAAFPEPYRLDARRCISYLTIEHEGPIPEAFRAAMGNRIYGCDDCLAVCPWNKYASATKDYAFLPRAELTAPKLVELAALDDASFRALFAGSPIKRIGRERFIRNVAIALGNDGSPEARAALDRLTRDESPVVAEAAQWGLAQTIQN
ncbi:MAG: tRNA epoxyqueuosine(34) reductase QueG [Dongiaceae bacterium]